MSDALLLLVGFPRAWTDCTARTAWRETNATARARGKSARNIGTHSTETASARQSFAWKMLLYEAGDSHPRGGCVPARDSRTRVGTRPVDPCPLRGAPRVPLGAIATCATVFASPGRRRPVCRFLDCVISDSCHVGCVCLQLTAASAAATSGRIPWPGSAPTSDRCAPCSPSAVRNDPKSGSGRVGARSSHPVTATSKTVSLVQVRRPVSLAS